MSFLILSKVRIYDLQRGELNVQITSQQKLHHNLPNSWTDALGAVNVAALYRCKYTYFTFFMKRHSVYILLSDVT